MEEQEMPCDGRKRELAEEDEEEVDDSNDSGKSHYAYDSDDSDFELIDGTKVDPKGFDITVYPGASFNSSIVPLKSYLTDPNKKQKYTDLCGLAIGDFNSQSAKKSYTEATPSVMKRKCLTVTEDDNDDGEARKILKSIGESDISVGR